MLHVGIREKPRLVVTLNQNSRSSNPSNPLIKVVGMKLSVQHYSPLKGPKASLMDFELVLPKELDNLGGFPKRQELDRFSPDVYLAKEVSVLMG